MTDRTVAQLVVSYQDTKGNWQMAQKGDSIQVHPDDVARLDAAGALEPVKPSK